MKFNVTSSYRFQKETIIKNGKRPSHWDFSGKANIMWNCVYDQQSFVVTQNSQMGATLQISQVLQHMWKRICFPRRLLFVILFWYYWNSAVYYTDIYTLIHAKLI